MAAVDDDGGGQIRRRKLRAGFEENLRGVIRPAATATEHQHSPGIARGRYHAGAAVVVDAEEAMGCTGRLHGIDGGLERTVGGVLEAHRHRQAAGHLAVRGGFRGAGPDRAQHDRVGDVLRRDRLQELGRRRQPKLRDFDQQAPRQSQAGANVE